jgi:hypothetical protein
MGKLSIVVDDALEKRFRIKVIEKIGTHKGSLSDAIALAMELWLKEG